MLMPANSAAVSAALARVFHARATISATGKRIASCGLIASRPMAMPASTGRLSRQAIAVAASPAVSMAFCPISTVTNTAGEPSTVVQARWPGATRPASSATVAFT